MKSVHLSLIAYSARHGREELQSLAHRRQCRWGGGAVTRETPDAELSRQLAEMGRQIPPLGLRRIESEDRRVDVDDLVALALALGVSPITLLMPETASRDDVVKATGREPVPAQALGAG